MNQMDQSIVKRHNHMNKGMDCHFQSGVVI